MSDPKLDFEPLFFILDKCQLKVLAAKKQDKYEVSGVYVTYDRTNESWNIWPASFNSQLPWEFPTRFEITNNDQEAWLFAEVMSLCKPLPEEWCQLNYPRSKDFPVY